jgi:dTDP-glucose pyrophosphorylase
MSDLVGLIPAAGRGVRAYPYTTTIPKSMLEVDGVPIIERNVRLLRDRLGVRDVRIVVGHRGEVIRDHFGDGSALGVKITCVTNPRLDLELPYSVYLAGRDIDRHCCMILADECYVDTDHDKLLAPVYRDAMVTCSLMEAGDAKHIRKNYVVTLHDGFITDLIEKPKTVSGNLMGTGTYLLHPDVFRKLAAAFDHPETRPKDWTSWLAGLAREGDRIRPCHLHGSYVNVNSRDDLNYANYLVRDRGFDEQKKSLVYVVDEETEPAVRAALDFAGQPIDEIVVVARRSSPLLEEVASHPRIRIVIAERPGAETGALVRLGLDSAQGSILILAYADTTFAPSDVSKLLVYLRDADMVVGTRTTRQMIEQGANMRGLVRLANVVLAKLVEVLWWRFECRFTDINCVYRAFWRATYHTIRGNLTATGVEIFPELSLETLRARRRIIEVPVNYYNHDVGSEYVRHKYQSAETFRRILSLILRKRWGDLWLRAR